MAKSLIQKTILLCGGGHCHTLLLRRWGERPLPGVRLILVTPEPLGPYSGMLPGYLAGRYRHEQVHINLARLCRWAGAELRETRVCGIEPAQRLLQLGDGRRLHYDLVSLDIGGDAAHTVEGVAEHALAVKPVTGFIARWEAIRASLRASNAASRILVTGGGAASVEILLALAQATLADTAIRHKPVFTLLTRNERLLPGYPPGIAARVLTRCAALGIQVMTGCTVTGVLPMQLTAATAQGTLQLPFEHLLWCTETAAPAWLRESPLALDEQGFVAVEATLRSSSHFGIFACGDVARLLPHGVPKAGVHAVRQAPILLANLQATLRGEELVPYQPPLHTLSLLDLGDGTAVGARGNLVFAGAWAGHWKRMIDQAFMRQFSALPARRRR